MNYSFMTFSTPSLTLAEVLATAREYGYDGIEPRLDVGHRHGIEVTAGAQDRTAIRRHVADSGIVLACLATSLTYADPAQTAAMLPATYERIDLAGELGVSVIRVFGGRIPSGVSRQAAIDLLIDSLGRVADYAAQRGVTVAMETHDDWCDPQHVAAVMRGLDHPAVAANWDIMHPVRTAHVTIDESFAALRPWVRHVHLHDGEATAMVPIGEGRIDHRRTVELLLATNYTGFLSGEWIDWEDYRIHLPRELATLKRYEKQSGRAERG
jgi:sugar phosphate isomerase/epimerase